MTRAVVYPIFIPQAGCPFRCLYCDQTITTGGSELPTPAQLQATLNNWLPDSGAGEIAFYGGSFTLLSAEDQIGYLAIAADFVERGRAGGIRLSTRPDGLETQHLELLSDYPVTTVEVGCQSFSAQVLSSSQRGYTVLDILAGVARINEVGTWRLGLQLMPGLPGSTADEALGSLRSALLCKPDFIRIYPTLVLAGTELDGLYQSGKYVPMPLEQAVVLVASMVVVATIVNVSVERIGLQGDPGWLESGGSLQAGPYHPAFGQLVRTEIWRKILCRLMEANTQDYEIVVPVRYQSDVLGQHRSNLKYLSDRFGSVHVRGSRDLDDDQFSVNDDVYARHQQLRAAYQDVINDTII